MYYKSGLPRVVGEFDAERLNNEVARIAEELGTSRPHEIERTLADDQERPHMTMSEIANIEWRRLSFPGGYGSITTDGDVDGLEALEFFRKGLVDEWHPDDFDGVVFNMPRILTGASCYPTKFLVGKIALPKNSLNHLTDYEFWRYEEIREAVDNAITKGDAVPMSFLPGQVVTVRPGTIHKRDIPEGVTGFRYFMRKFPKIGLGYSGTAYARLRFF